MLYSSLLGEHMRIDELTRPNTRGLAGYELKQRGYEKLGKGAFATIWAKPGEDFVIKIVDNDDKSYQKYISLIQSNNNEHFPVLKSKLIKMNEKYSAIKMERLVPMSDQQYIQIGLAPAYNYLNFLRKGAAPIEEVNTTKMKIEIEALEKNQPGIKEAFKIIADNFQNFDVHPYNVMLRGSTVVLTDPVL